ncbi:cytochrome D ubiquinol oxidase subunit 1 [Prevotella sp. CAG:1092]|nr:cytochrome D ubiquinol oxidase subunit 1 [Prevotella sp. CAG:1092]
MMHNLLLDITTGTIDWARAQFALTAIYYEGIERNKDREEPHGGFRW